MFNRDTPLENGPESAESSQALFINSNDTNITMTISTSRNLLAAFDQSVITATLICIARLRRRRNINTLCSQQQPQSCTPFKKSKRFSNTTYERGLVTPVNNPHSLASRITNKRQTRGSSTRGPLRGGGGGGGPRDRHSPAGTNKRTDRLDPHGAEL